MKFNIGDNVSVLDKDLKGVIKSTNQFKSIIIDEHGFDYEILNSKLVYIPNKGDYQNSLEDIDKVVLSKSKINSTKLSKSHVKRKVLTVDLHMHSITDSTRGMSNHDMVMQQINEVQKHLDSIDKRYYSKIIFIHGIGSGKLKIEIEKYLLFRKISFQDASYQNHGRGATEVLL